MTLFITSDDLGLGLVSSGLGLGLVTLVLVLRISSFYITVVDFYLLLDRNKFGLI